MANSTDELGTWEDTMMAFGPSGTWFLKVLTAPIPFSIILQLPAAKWYEDGFVNCESLIPEPRPA